MKRLFTVMVLVCLTLLGFGQNQPSGGVWATINSKSLIDQYPQYRVDTTKPLFDVGFNVGDIIYMLSYESNTVDSPTRNAYLYKQNMYDNTDHWTKATETPIQTFVSVEDNRFLRYYEMVTSTANFNGISHVEDLSEWDGVKLINLQVARDKNPDRSERYTYMILVFLVPIEHGMYEPYVFTPKNIYPDYFYFMNQIEYDENRNEYSFTFSKQKEGHEDFRLYFTYNNGRINISNDSIYESNTLY
jgi:hypothetical protein